MRRGNRSRLGAISSAAIAISMSAYCANAAAVDESDEIVAAALQRVPRPEIFSLENGLRVLVQPIPWQSQVGVAINYARRRRASSMQSTSIKIASKIHKTAEEGVWGPNSPASLSIDGAGREAREYSDAAVRAFLQRTYRPKDAILVAVGPFFASGAQLAQSIAFMSPGQMIAVVTGDPALVDKFGKRRSSASGKAFRR
jgi:hypothetical protein